jgi:Sterol-sensing domain of SREBP cleavage-activation
MMSLLNDHARGQVKEYRTPKGAYPFIVLAINLENMFRTVKAVVKTRPEDPSTSRIAKALGNSGYVIVVAAAQNLTLLYIISKIVMFPEVADFYVFIAVAITVDLILHLTFFVAVLSLDLRRLGLKDSINGTIDYVSGSLKRVTARPPSLLGSAFRMRTIGTIVIVCYVIALSWRYSPKDLPLLSLRVEPISTVPAQTTQSVPMVSRDALQAEMPAAWLRVQDTDTVKEIAQAMEFQRHCFVGNVHEPLIFISKDANRTQAQHGHDTNISFLFSNLRLLKSHYPQLILYIALTSAIAGLLVNCLHSELAEGGSDASNEKKLQLTIQSLDHSHSIDVVNLAASAKGVLASVQLDRRILIWRLGGDQPTLDSVVNAARNTSHRILWPVADIAIDSHAEWLAIRPRAGHISFWHIPTKRFGYSPMVKFASTEVLVSFFVPQLPGLDNIPPGNARLILIRKNGLMTEIEVSRKPDPVGTVVDHQISAPGTSPLFSSNPLYSSRMPLRLVSTTREGGMYVTAKRGGRSWATERIGWPKAQMAIEIQDMEFVPMRALGMMGLVRSTNSSDVHLLDVQLCIYSRLQSCTQDLRLLSCCFSLGR